MTQAVTDGLVNSEVLTLYRYLCVPGNDEVGIHHKDEVVLTSNDLPDLIAAKCLESVCQSGGIYMSEALVAFKAFYESIIRFAKNCAHSLLNAQNIETITFSVLDRHLVTVRPNDLPPEKQYLDAAKGVWYDKWWPEEIRSFDFATLVARSSITNLSIVKASRDQQRTATEADTG